MYTAEEIALWLLSYNEEQISRCGADKISNLKLQKLLYYTQGCYLGMYGTTLFDDELMAWLHGPVVPSVYHLYKHNGDQGISLDQNAVIPQINEETKAVLEEVYSVFGQYSAWKLREMTHEESPWNETAQSEIIPKEKIRQYFVKEYIVNDE